MSLKYDIVSILPFEIEISLYSNSVKLDEFDNLRTCTSKEVDAFPLDKNWNITVKVEDQE